MRTKLKSALPKSLITAAWIAAGAMNAHATDGTWMNLSGNWSDSAHWTDGSIAGGAGSTANLAAVGVTSSGMTVTIDNTSRTVGSLYIGDSSGTAGAVTLAASGDATLTFDNNGSAALLRMGNPAGGNGSSSGNPVAMVSAGVLLNDSLNVENNFNLTNSVLRISGDISAGSAGTKVITHITNAGARSNAGTTISGAISDGEGVVAVVQNSTTGNLTLAKANSYSGGTTITAGTLLLTGGSTIGTGNLDIAAGAAWDITGISADVYSMTAGQTLSGGGTIHATGKGIIFAGTLASHGLEIEGDFTLASSAVSNFEIGGLSLDSHDELTASGLLALGGTLNLSTTYSAQIGDTVTLFDGGLITGAFSEVTGLDLGNGLSWSIDNLGIDGTITVVPEPGCVSLLALAGIAGLMGWRGAKTRRTGLPL